MSPIFLIFDNLSFYYQIMSHAKHILNQFLGRFSILKPEEREGLLEKLVVETYSKKTILQEEGKVPQQCFFVLKGCIRQYQNVDGVERTTEFYTDTHGVVSSDCYTQQIPSDFSLECLEDSIILVGELERDTALVTEFPVLQHIMMEMAEAEWAKTQKSLTAFKLQSPESRYRDFLQNRKDLTNRVASHQVASYLGITPESLSRIRKRILTQERND